MLPIKTNSIPYKFQTKSIPINFWQPISIMIQADWTVNNWCVSEDLQYFSKLKLIILSTRSL